MTEFEDYDVSGGLSHLEETCRRNRQRTEQVLAYYAAQLNQIDQRLKELEEEWDLDQAVMAASAGVSASGLLMAVMGSRKSLLMPLAAAGFMLHYALTGWNGLSSLLYRMGVRSVQEIDEERTALKALRGDFAKLQGQGEAIPRAKAALEAARKNAAE